MQYSIYTARVRREYGGMKRRESLSMNYYLMRQDGLLADSHDMQAWITKSTMVRNLDAMLRLEQFMLQQFSEESRRFSYKELNEEAQKAGMNYSNVKRMRMLLHFMTLKGYIYKQEHSITGYVNVRLQSSKEVTKNRFERRMDISRFIVDCLSAQKDDSKDTTLVNFSVVELLQQFITSRHETMFSDNEKPTIADIEEALLYLTKTELMKIEGGFLVIYNTMQIGRLVATRTRYGKEQYRLLDEFYSSESARYTLSANMQT